MTEYGISDSLVYRPKPRAAMGSKVRLNQPCLNGTTFSPGETMQISIPSGTKGQFLNCRQSYLKFTVKNTGASALTPDYSASSFIRNLEVVYGSSVLENIDQYACLYHLISDAQGEASQATHSANVLEGTHDSTARAGADIAAGATRTFCIPLVSGVLGAQQKFYLPIGDMVRNHLRLNLTLNSVSDAQKSATSTSWTISDVEYVAEILQLNSETAKAISSMNAGGYRIPMVTFTNHAATLSSGVANANILISGNYASLKTLFTVFRLQTNSSNGNKGFQSARTNPFGTRYRWHYMVGPYATPQKPVDSNVEAYAELMKSLHAFGAADNHGKITYATWTAAEGTYVVAQDLESQSHKSMISESGVDVRSSQIHLVAEFDSLTAALRVDTFCHVDATLFIDNTGMAQTLS